MMSQGQGIYGGLGNVTEQLQVGFTQKAFSQLLSSNLSSSEAIAHELISYIGESIDSVVELFLNASLYTTYPLDRLSNGNVPLRAYDQGGNVTYGAVVDALE